MKKVFILFALIYFIPFSYAHLSRFYIIDLPQYGSLERLSNFHLYFDMCDDGSYGIHFERKPYLDMIETGYTISIGKYEIKNDVVVLTDSYTDCKMLFQLNSSNLKPLKTFPFIKELPFKEYYIGSSSYEPYFKMKETTAEKLVKEFEAKNLSNHPFLEGLSKFTTKNNPFIDRFSKFISDGLIKGLYRYEYEFYRGERFEIKLDKDNKYEFNFKVWKYSPSSKKDELDLCLIISSGIWARQGNILTLWDINLQHNFYGLIRKDGSIELLFFRWGEDMIFKKI